MTKKPSILIAGGGIAGLTLALALSRRGLANTVLEQAEEFSALGAGIQLSPNASRLLIALGLEEQLASAASSPEELRIQLARTGECLNRIPLGAPAAERYGAPYWSVHRADLQAVLLEAVRAAGVSDIVTAARVTDFTQEADRVVAVTGGGRELSADALIGGDGVHSKVRAQLLQDGPPDYTGYMAWRALISASEAPQGIGRAATSLWLGRTAHLVHYPVRSGEKINIVAITGTPQQQQGYSNAASLSDLLPYYEDWPGAPLALLNKAESWQSWSLFDRAPAKRWSGGRVTLMGDAAHPCLPFQAQGGAMAIEDACVLAQGLAETQDIAAAFSHYENRRRARTARVQREARLNGRIYHLTGIAGWVRNRVLAALPPALLVRRQDWLYGYGT